jgi:phage-related protein
MGLQARATGGDATRGMSETDRAARDAARGVSASMGDITNSFNTFNTVIGGVAPTVSASVLGMVAKIGLLGAGAAASSAAVGAALGGLPLLFGGIGAMLVSSAIKTNAKLKAEFTDAGDSIKNTFLKAGQPMVQGILTIAQDAADAFKQMGPGLHQAFASAAPEVETFAAGLLGLVQNVLPGMNAALKVAMPAVNALAGGLASLGTGLGGFFQNLSAGVQGGAAGLFSLLNMVAQLLPMLGSGLAAIAGPASQALGILAQFVLKLVGSIGSGLKPVLDALLPIFGQVLTALMPLLPVIGHLVAAFAPVISTLGAALIPIFRELVGVVATLVPAVTPLLPPLFMLLSPIENMIGPLLQLAAAMGQALLPIIGAIIPVLQHLNDTISGGLGTAFLKIGQAIIPILPILGQLVQVVGGALVQALQILMPPLSLLIQSGLGMLLQAIAPILPMLGQILAPLLVSIAQLLAALLTALMPLLAPLMQLAGFILKQVAEAFVDVSGKVSMIITWLAEHLQPAVKATGNWFVWLWQQVIVPAWNGIVEAARVAWDWLNTWVFQPIIVIVKMVAGVYIWLWQNVIVPAWNGITQVIGTAWSWLQANVFGPLGDKIQFLGKMWNWYWQNVIVPVWDGIQKAIGSAWDWLTQHVFDPIGHVIDGLVKSFQNGGDQIGKAWDKIRDAAKQPVQFLIDTVYNNGIRTMWNDVASLVGVGQLPALTFATGGTVPGYSPGNDVVSAMLSPGEGVLIPQAVRMLGGAAGIDALNRNAKGGTAHFADGGIVGSIGDFLGGIANAFKDVALGGVRAAATPVIQGLEHLADGSLGSTGFGGLLDHGVHSIGDGVLAFLGGKDKTASTSAVSSPGAVSGNLAGWVTAAMAAVGVSGADWVNGLETIAMHESGGNPNATNNWDSNAAAGDPSRGLMQTIMSTFNAYRLGSLSNNIFDPVSNIAAGIRYIQSRYGGIGSVPGLVSMAHGGGYVGYDSGGWLEPGLTLAYNGTGRREAITSPSGAGPHGGGGIYLDFRGSQVMSDHDIQLLIDRIGRELATWVLPSAGVQIRR